MPDDEVHLLWTRTDARITSAARTRQAALLCAAERARGRQLLRESARRQFVVSHALVRDALSQFTPVCPEDWRFSTNRYGRPGIAAPAAYDGLRYSLSHTEGVCVVALARGMDVGVDIERANRHADLMEMLAETFHPIELEQIKADPQRTLDLWVLKEAYLKARGVGFSVSLNTFGFDLRSPARPLLTCSEGVNDSSRWSFYVGRGKEFKLALAWPGLRPMRIVCRELVYPVHSSGAAGELLTIEFATDGGVL